MRPRVGAQARCSGCAKPARGYDQLPQRRFEFIPVWGFAVELLYSMLRVQCRSCGVKVEQVPWAAGKHTLTRAYMLHLAHWARKLSWQETALSANSSLRFELELERVRHLRNPFHRTPPTALLSRAAVGAR